MAKHDIIIIAADPWENYTWRRRHHVAWNLARNNRVLFIEPPLTFLQPFKYIDLNWKHSLNLGRFKKQSKNLYTYSPVRLLPLSLPGTNRFDYYEIDKQRTFRVLKKIVKRLEFRNPILWIYFSNLQYDYYNLFDEKIVVTDWYDDFSAPSGGLQSNDTIRNAQQRENDLLQRADIIFAVSKELKEKIARYRDDVITINHGVDFDLYLDINKFSQKVAFPHKLKKPVLCFMGTMQSKIDFELLIYITSKNPNYSLLLIGREWFNNQQDKKRFIELIKQENVFYCNEVSHNKIPYYLSHADVCLIPFKDMQINYVTSAPLKLLEYFAAGKPVVATDLGRNYENSEFIRTASNYDEFCSQIALAIEEGSDKELIIKRREIAKENSWLAKTNQMLKIIEQHLFTNSAMRRRSKQINSDKITI